MKPMKKSLLSLAVLTHLRTKNITNVAQNPLHETKETQRMIFFLFAVTRTKEWRPR